jgi:hypothetical protein
MVAAVVAWVLLAALAAFQIALAAGAPVGHLAWGGQQRVLTPRLRVASAVNVVVYALIAWFVGGAADVASEPGDRTHSAAWVLTAFFALGVLMNAASRSRAERSVMTPVAVVLTLCCLALALG